MKTKMFTLIALAGALAFGGTLASAQDGTTPSTTDPVITEPATPDSIRGLMEQFRAQRQGLLEARAGLIEQLRNCTAEEREAIVAKFREQYGVLLRDQMQLRKQIRLEMRNLRHERRQVRSGAGG